MYKQLLFVLLLSAATRAQSLHFEYDPAGNQIKRELILTSGRPSGTTTKEAAVFEKFFEEDVISYYPNPVSEELHLRWENKDDLWVSAIDVYDLSGRKISSVAGKKDSFSQSIGFGNLAEGTYFVLLVYSDSTTKSIKIIKK